jgi:magnesium-transporting ATPase (P-type)
MKDRGMTKKGDIGKPSLVMRIFGPLVFILGAIGALWWFFYSVFNLYKSLSSEVVEFDKSAFYFLGGGIALFIFAIVAVQRFWFNKLLSKRQNAYLARVTLASIVLMLILPQIFHYFMNDYMVERGYSVCRAAPYWEHSPPIIYIKPTIECKEGIDDLFTYKPKVTLENFRKK